MSNNPDALVIDIVYDHAPRKLPVMENDNSILAYSPYAHDFEIRPGASRIDIGFGIRCPPTHKLWISPVAMLFARGVSILITTWECDSGDERVKLYLFNCRDESVTMPQGAALVLISLVQIHTPLALRMTDTEGAVYRKGSWKATSWDD